MNAVYRGNEVDIDVDEFIKGSIEDLKAFAEENQVDIYIRNGKLVFEERS